MTASALQRRLALALPLAAAALMALSATSRQAAAGKAECGKPGKPPCPMQAWMRRELTAPYAKKNWTKLATALNRLASLNPNPKKWANWDRLCREGAKAARAKNQQGALSSCTRCHKAYRRAYNVAYRKRRLSE